MEKSFKIEVITPEKIVFSGEISMATVPSYEGYMSILEHHIPIITFLKPGIVKIFNNDISFKEFFVQDGTVEYFNENLTILSTSVFDLKNISKEFLENLNKETLKELENKDNTDHDLYILNHKLDIIKNIRI